MTRARKAQPRRRLPVVESPQVRCEKLLATLPEATCAARWRLAQSRSVVRTSGTVCGGWSYEGEQYASCRGCAVGATRAGGAT